MSSKFPGLKGIGPPRQTIALGKYERETRSISRVKSCDEACFEKKQTIPFEMQEVHSVSFLVFEVLS